MQILRFPLSRFTLCFVLGIGLQRLFAFPIVYLLGIGATSLLLAFYFFVRAHKSKPAQTHFGIAVMFAGIASGAFCLVAHSDVNKQSHYLHRMSQETQILQVKILEKLKTTEAFEKYVCDVERLDKRTTSGKILLNFRKNGKTYDLPTGLRLIAVSKLIGHKPPLNPNQFDYGAYLVNRNIYAQSYVDNFIRLDIDKDIFNYCDALRKQILSNLRKSGLPEKELAVFAALLLGQQQDIDQETLRDYQFAGAVHILSVSGLHVGFVLLLLDFLLGYLPRTKK